MLSQEELSAIYISMKVAVCSTLLILPPGIFISWVLAKSRIRGKSVIDTLVSLPLALAPVVSGFFLLILISRTGLVGRTLYGEFGIELPFTWYAAVLASALIAFPLLVRVVRVAMEEVDPRLENAARTLGAGPWRVFYTVTLPLAIRGVIAGSILAFTRSLGEFGATIMVAGNIPGKTQTIPLAVFNYVQTGHDEKGIRLVLIATVLAFFALFLAQNISKRTTH
ncbi:MAG: molybdate ABC transporter permease subunit [Candidatus Brocadiales bacterium]|nr:molybdate ABC transporter permease subunit [Candidatus Bathyanammoxibius sp.]MCQ4574981.1 molybdate ABC transporter permease subunit [Candidatus Bathyanammoxibius amoris]